MGASDAWDGSAGEGEGWGDSAGTSEACDSPQEGSEAWDKPIGDSTPIDQFCSSCNQKKPLRDFGRFLTCNPCRQRNRKAN
jgi:hypothetical protein